MNLSGDRGPVYSLAYYDLLLHWQVKDTQSDPRHGTGLVERTRVPVPGGDHWSGMAVIGAQSISSWHVARFTVLFVDDAVATRGALAVTSRIAVPVVAVVATVVASFAPLY